MLVPILLLFSLTLLLLLTLFILRRPGLGLRIRLARIPHALSHRWRAQTKSRYKKALQPLSLQRLSLERFSQGPLSRGPLSSQDVFKLEDAGRAGYHNPFDPSPSPSPSPSLRDVGSSSCSSSEGLSSSPSPSSTSPPPLHPVTSPRLSHLANTISLCTETTATPPPLPLPPQLPYLDPCKSQRIIKQATQRQGIEPSGAYDNVIPFHHGNDSKIGHRAPSPAIKSRSPVPSPLSWDTQLDKYFYADGVGIRGE